MESTSASPKIHYLYIPNTLTPNSVEEINAELAKIEKISEPAVLIITSKHPKIFCAGMDLKFISKNGIEAGKTIAEGLMKILARVLRLPCSTIAMVNGHAIAAGLLMALSADYVIMAEESGKVAMTEVLIGMVVPSGANLLLKAKLHPSVHRDLVLRGLYFDTKKAFESKIVDKLVPKGELEKRTLEVAQEMLDSGEICQLARGQRLAMYKDVIAKCEQGKFDHEFIEVMRNYKI